ncbi:hypothetical protein C2G38_2231605 [Gigaspora rosea]|uniref:Uncharacterized protein n=1 Tax=Gigaspora rosea TaxID=44941 RepID=A0A397U1C0_9GLOM|nr:hypothetical protein C2G38_2231605 [Gigaspora rosea]
MFDLLYCIVSDCCIVLYVDWLLCYLYWNIIDISDLKIFLFHITYRLLYCIRLSYCIVLLKKS